MPEIKYFTQEELKKFFNTVKKHGSLRDYALFNVMYYCGLRVSEVGLLRISSYNKDNGSIYCQRIKKGISGTVTLDIERQKILNKYLKSLKDTIKTQPLFISRQSTCLHRNTIWQMVKMYIKKANLEDKGTHSFRHSIAIHLLESEANIYWVKSHLGHKNISSTMHYLQYTAVQSSKMSDLMKESNFIVR
tara:strand:- start:1565 stop:2134 length:570 start_codon:yes stop_codon:yes gene_type:complete